MQRGGKGEEAMRQIWWVGQYLVEIFDDDETDRAVRSGAAL